MIALHGGVRRSMGRRRLVLVCAWCRHVKVGDEWRADCPQPLESHASHGICPECFRREVEAARAHSEGQER